MSLHVSQTLIILLPTTSCHALQYNIVHKINDVTSVTWHRLMECYIQRVSNKKMDSNQRSSCSPPSVPRRSRQQGQDSDEDVYCIQVDSHGPTIATQAQVKASRLKQLCLWWDPAAQEVVNIAWWKCSTGLEIVLGDTRIALHIAIPFPLITI